MPLCNEIAKAFELLLALPWRPIISGASHHLQASWYNMQTTQEWSRAIWPTGKYQQKLTVNGVFYFILYDVDE